jgi:hypothetical protein
MQIGIIGAGNIGRTAAELFAEAGHEVALSNSRGPESLSEVVAELGPQAQAVTPAGAADWGDVVLLAVPFRHLEGLPGADRFGDAVVIDATNPYTEDFEIMEIGDDTSSELVADQLPGVRLVKAFNTMYWETLRDEARPEAPLEERLALFLAGDDQTAKSTVSGLIEDAGFAAVDTGSLREGGRYQQPGSAIYNEPLKKHEAERRLQELRE